MASVGDVFRIKMISEQQGVAMTNLLYFKIDDLGTDGPIADQLQSWGDQFLAACTAQMATSWAITCLVYKNITATDVQVPVFTNLLGTAVNNPHAPHGVIRFNKYANIVAQTEGKHGGFNLSGTQNTASNKGRVAVEANWTSLIAFLKGPNTLDTDGWDVTPQLRWLSAPGPPKVYTFDKLISVRISTRYNILASRRSKLCQIG